MKLPRSLTAPPLRAEDLLAADTPVQPLGTRWFHNPLLRLLWFGLLVVALSVAALPVALATGANLSSLATNAVLQIVVIGSAYLVLTLLIERRRPPFELAPSRAFALVIGLGIGAGLFLLCFAIIALAGGYRFEGVDDGYSWAVPLLVLGAGAGIAEEILFRGVLFRLLEELVGSWLAAALSGGLFGLAHLANPDATWWGALAIAVEAGLSFALLYGLTRSLWVCIGAHAAWNIVQGPVLGVPVSGSGFSDGWLATVSVGPDWLTGGTFGAEASPVTVLIMVAATVWLALQIVRRDAAVAPRWTRKRRLRERAAAA